MRRHVSDLSAAGIERRASSVAHGPVDRDVELFVSNEDVADPELSIVIPALNEELTVGRFVDWCREGLREANVRGEIIIVDSSSDRTAESRSPGERESLKRRNVDWDGHISMPSRSSAANMC